MNALRDAKILWNSLNGVICIYKPPQYPWSGVSKIIRQKIGHEINSRVPTKGIGYHSNPLVIGPVVTISRIAVYSTLTDFMTSGVAVVGVRAAWNVVCSHHRTGPIKVYQVKGRLGIGTDTFDMLGNVLERASYFHVTREILDKVLSTIQANYQRTMYDASGVHIQSQAAYELAVGGLIRPAIRHLPLFYSIKCIDFQLPEFTVEVQCINENSLYLKRMIHEIGFRLRTVAACSAIRCIRYGPFTVEHAMARHNWNLENFIDNMDEYTKMLIGDLVSDRRKSPHLTAPSDTAWEELEKKLIDRGVVIRKQLNSSDREKSNPISRLLASKEWEAKETKANS